MTQGSRNCEVVYMLMDKMREEIPSDSPESKIRQTVHENCSIAVGALRGRGLPGLADQARRTLSEKGLDFTITFRDGKLVIRIENCACAKNKDNQSCRFAQIFLDEICQWAGYTVQIEQTPENHYCFQTFVKEPS